MGRYATLGPKHENVLPESVPLYCPIRPEEIRLPDAGFAVPTTTVRRDAGVGPGMT